MVAAAGMSERAPKVLSEAQREQYVRDGWVAVEGLIDDGWLSRLTAVTAAFVELSRYQRASNRPTATPSRASGASTGQSGSIRCTGSSPPGRCWWTWWRTS